MNVKTDRGIVENTGRNIVFLWIGGFVVPPVGWVLGNWFLGLWSAQETLTIIFSPLFWLYPIGYNIGCALYLRKQMDVVTTFLTHPDASPEQAQRTVAVLPKAFLGLITIYCLIGPHTGMAWKPFLTRTEYILGALLGLPFILCFSIPFFMALIIHWEYFAAGVPLSHETPTLQLRGKIFLSAYLVFIGGAILMLVLAYSCFVTASSIEDGLSALVFKGAVLALAVSANAALVLVLLTRHINVAARAATQCLTSVMQGDFDPEFTVFTKGEMGFLLKTGQDMAAKIRLVVQETDRLTQAIRQGNLDARADTAGLTGGWHDLVMGVNKVIEAFMEPFTITANYLDRIARGDIPQQVTGEFQGGFVEVIHNLNQCIDTTLGLAAETSALTEAALQGRFDVRGDVGSFGGDYATIVQGMNNIIATLVGHIDQIPMPVMILDTEFSINFINKAGAELLDVPKERVIGRTCYDFFKSTDCHTGKCACGRAMQSGRVETGETIARPHGKDILASYTGIPLKDESGAIIGALEIVMDQTEVKQAMRAIERQNWLRTGQAELGNAMRGEQDLTTLGKNVITYLAGYLKAEIGAIYLAQRLNENTSLRLLAGHAYTRRNASGNTIKPGDGFVGQAAEELETILYSDIPEDYLPIKTEFGYETPNEVLVCPLLYQGELKGVLELGTTGRFNDEHLEFLTLAAENVAITLHSAQTRQQMQELLNR